MRNSKANTETEKVGGVEEERLGGIKRKKTTTIIDDEEIREGLTNDVYLITELNLKKAHCG